MAAKSKYLNFPIEAADHRKLKLLCLHRDPLGQLPASALGLALQVGFDPLEKGFRDLEGHRSAVVSHSRFTSVFLHFVVFE